MNELKIKNYGKCPFCGSPQTKKLNDTEYLCEYCGKVSVIDTKTKSLFIKKDIKTWLIKAKNKINTKLIQPGIILLENQKIISNDQIKLVEKYIQKGLFNKRNVVLLVVIPFGFYLYMIVNYPTTAKPYYPDLPFSMPDSEETGNFVFYANNKTKEGLAYSKYICKDKISDGTLSECLSRSHGHMKYYIDLESEKKKDNWLVYKLGASWRGNQVNAVDDAAINCKKSPGANEP